MIESLIYEVDLRVGGYMCCYLNDGSTHPLCIFRISGLSRINFHAWMVFPVTQDYDIYYILMRMPLSYFFSFVFKAFVTCNFFSNLESLKKNRLFNQAIIFTDSVAVSMWVF